MESARFLCLLIPLYNLYLVKGRRIFRIEFMKNWFLEILIHPRYIHRIVLPIQSFLYLNIIVPQILRELKRDLQFTDTSRISPFMGSLSVRILIFYIFTLVDNRLIRKAIGNKNKNK